MVLDHMVKLYFLFAIAVLLSGIPVAEALAQSDRASVPTIEQPGTALPDEPVLTQLRFITDNDYPPFNYIDENGKLVGFNVELAKAICAELKVRCSIQALVWDRMITAIENDAADAIIASLAITRKNRRRVTFSRQYYQTPARFVSRKSDGFKDITPEILSGKRIGVAKNTSHEAYLKAFFKTSIIKSFDGPDAARQALVDGQVDVVFGDGVSLMFWLNGIASNKCCTYSGGAFTESKFFGEGVGIAVKKNNPQLLKVINLGLDRVQKSGQFEELFKRYFPMSFY